MKQFLICDDQPEHALWLKKLLAAAIRATGESYIVKVLKTSAELYLDLESYQDYDAIFLDIEMPKFTGFQIAEELNSHFPGMLIVFVSAHDELVFESFLYQLVFFLRKSRLKEELPAIVEKILTLSEKRRAACLSFKSGGKYYKIAHSDIYYLESRRNQVHLFTNKDEYALYSTLGKLYKQLPKPIFLKSHGSFIVNVGHIKIISANTLILTNGSSIPLSRTNRRPLLESLQQLSIESNF